MSEDRVPVTDVRNPGGRILDAWSRDKDRIKPGRYKYDLHAVIGAYFIQIGRAAHLTSWLRRKLDSEAGLLIVAERAAAAYLAYENGTAGDLDEVMAALGSALAEHAARHKPATQADADGEEIQLAVLLAADGSEATT